MFDILIIGGGPAGLTAALYAARAGRKAAVLEKEFAGGQIVNSPLVENYPVIAAISGAEFAENLQKQVEALGVAFINEEAVQITKEGDLFTAATSRGRSYAARTVILATGVSHRTLGLPAEEELIGAGISFCAVCDGAFYRGADVAVIGGGDTALQDALYLANICRTVYIVHRRDAFRAAAQLVNRAREKENIVLVTDSVPEEYLQEDNVVTGLAVKNKFTGERRELPVEGVFLAVGQVPQSGFLSGLVDLTPEGYIIAGEDCRTNIPGLFTAGDCRVKAVRQLTTAVGDGAVAALAACDLLDQEENEAQG